MSRESVGTAVVLGARNLGGAITRDLLASGMRVATVARTQADLDTLSQAGAITVRADAADPGQLGDALCRAAAELGPLDLIVNAVSAARPPDDGTGFGGGAVTTASMAGFDGWTVPAARQAFVFLREGARALQGRGGTLIQITGAPARRANPQRGLIAAGMAAVRALTHATAQELRQDGVHVALLIVDGLIDSPKTAHMSAGLATDALVRQEDVVHAVRFLAHPVAARHDTRTRHHGRRRPLAPLSDYEQRFRPQARTFPKVEPADKSRSGSRSGRHVSWRGMASQLQPPAGAKIPAKRGLSAKDGDLQQLYGSDGTRTRDLRRDRPARRYRLRPAATRNYPLQRLLRKASERGLLSFALWSAGFRTGRRGWRRRSQPASGSGIAVPA